MALGKVRDKNRTAPISLTEAAGGVTPTEAATPSKSKPNATGADVDRVEAQHARAPDDPSQTVADFGGVDPKNTGSAWALQLRETDGDAVQQAAAAIVRALDDQGGTVADKIERLQSKEGLQMVRSLVESADVDGLVADVKKHLESEAAELDVELSSMKAKSKVAALYGRVGELSKKAVDSVRTRLSDIRTSLGDFLKAPLKGKLMSITKFIARNALLLIPAAATATAVATGEPTLPVFLNSLGFAGALWATDKVLQHEDLGLIPNMERLTPSHLDHAVRAGSTNLVEAGSVAGSSLRPGVSLESGPAGALSSNFWNTILLPAAYAAALPKRTANRQDAIEKETGERPSFVRALVDVLKRTRWKGIGKQAALAAGFAADAALFYVAAQHGLTSAPVLTWVAANIPAIALFLHHTAFSKKAQVTNSMQAFSTEEIGELKQRVSDLLGGDEQVYGLLDAMERYCTGLEARKPMDALSEERKEIMDGVTELARRVQEDPEFASKIASLEKEAPEVATLAKAVEFMRTHRVDAFEKRKIDKGAAIKATAALAGFGVCAFLLGQTAVALGTSLGMSLFVVNSLLVGAASSFPEFTVMKGLFEEGEDLDAAFMASGSNAVNAGLGVVGTMLYAGRQATVGA